jgi:hypothetical protein
MCRNNGHVFFRPENLGMNAAGPDIYATLLRLVRDRTGVPEPAISEAFRGSASFRDLCADVRVCSRALHRWKDEDSGEAERLTAEYEYLMDKLAKEIREAISDSGSGEADRCRAELGTSELTYRHVV